MRRVHHIDSTVLHRINYIQYVRGYEQIKNLNVGLSDVTWLTLGFVPVEAK